MKAIGASLILLGLLGVVPTVVGMIRAFNVLVTSGNPAPADLATSIQAGLIYTAIGAPVAVVGLVLLIVGYRREKRKP